MDRAVLGKPAICCPHPGLDVILMQKPGRRLLGSETTLYSSDQDSVQNRPPVVTSEASQLSRQPCDKVNLSRTHKVMPEHHIEAGEAAQIRN